MIKKIYNYVLALIQFAPKYEDEILQRIEEQIWQSYRTFSACNSFKETPLYDFDLRNVERAAKSRYNFYKQLYRDCEKAERETAYTVKDYILQKIYKLKYDLAESKNAQTTTTILEKIHWLQCVLIIDKKK